MTAGALSAPRSAANRKPQYSVEQNRKTLSGRSEVLSEVRDLFLCTESLCQLVHSGTSNL
jgi:hypothetical protein